MGEEKHAVEAGCKHHMHEDPKKSLKCTALFCRKYSFMCVHETLCSDLEQNRANSSDNLSPFSFPVFLLRYCLVKWRGSFAEHTSFR